MMMYQQGDIIIFKDSDLKGAWVADTSTCRTMNRFCLREVDGGNLSRVVARGNTEIALLDGAESQCSPNTVHKTGRIVLTDNLGCSGISWESYSAKT